MVIFILGLVGTGKTSVAKALSERLNIPHYDVDEVKKLVYPTDPDYQHNLENSIPFSDETRARVLHKVVEDFPTLASRHPIIIVEEVLSKQVLRQIVFEGAKKYFGDYTTIWIKSDEEIIKNRLMRNKREGHILQNPFGMYLALKNQFEDVNEANIIFNNDKPLSEGVEELVRLLQDKVNTNKK